MNGRLRESVTGPFRLSVTAAQQRVLVAVSEQALAGEWPVAVGQLVHRGLLLRIGERLEVTAAGHHVIGLLREAGLYDQARAGEPAATGDGALL